MPVAHPVSEHLRALGAEEGRRGAVERVAEATAMASRAPLDLRVNTLKAKREKMLTSLAHQSLRARRQTANSDDDKEGANP